MKALFSSIKKMPAIMYLVLLKCKSIINCNLSGELLVKWIDNPGSHVAREGVTL